MTDHYLISTLDRIIEELEELHDYTHEAEDWEKVSLTPVRHKIEEAVGPLYNAAGAARQALGQEEN